MVGRGYLIGNYSRALVVHVIFSEARIVSRQPVLSRPLSQNVLFLQTTSCSTFSQQYFIGYETLQHKYTLELQLFGSKLGIDCSCLGCASFTPNVNKPLYSETSGAVQNGWISLYRCRNTTACIVGSSIVVLFNGLSAQQTPARAVAMAADLPVEDSLFRLITLFFLTTQPGQSDPQSYPNNHVFSTCLLRSYHYIQRSLAIERR